MVFRNFFCDRHTLRTHCGRAYVCSAASSSNASSSTSSSPWDFYSAFWTCNLIFYNAFDKLFYWKPLIIGLLYPCYYAATRVSHSWGGWGCNFSPSLPHYALLMRKNVQSLAPTFILSRYHIAWGKTEGWKRPRPFLFAYRASKPLRNEARPSERSDQGLFLPKTQNKLFIPGCVQGCII